MKQHLPKDIRYYVQPQDKATVEQDGFTRVEVIEDKTTVEDMAIHRVSGHHGFGKIGEMMGPVSGYVLTAEGCPTVYIMGDCKWEDCIRDKVDGCIIPDEAEVMQMLDELPLQIKLIAVHMDAIDHCQTTREILRNEAWHHGADMNRLIIPEDGETINL